MKCYECRYLDRTMVLATYPPQYRCTQGYGTHFADHECEYEFAPVIRCEDCIYSDIEGHTTKYMTCFRFGDYSFSVSPHDFCSSGERK